MKIKIDKTRFVPLVIFILALAAWGQDAVVPVDTVAVDTARIVTVDTDSMVIVAEDGTAEDVDDAADFVEAEVEEVVDPDADVDDAADFAEYAAEGELSPSEQQKLEVVRRNHNYKRQVKLAIIMMTFIAVALMTSQSWNPQ